MAQNAFAAFLKRYSKQHPGLSGPELMRAASKAYKAQGGGSRRTAGSRKKSTSRRSPRPRGSVFLPQQPELGAHKLPGPPAGKLKRGTINEGVTAVRKLS